MSVQNADIAQIFADIADFLDILDANQFRVRAYRNGARTVEELGRDIASMVEAEEDLTDLPAIGKDLAAKCREIVETGRCDELEQLKQQVPPGLIDVLELQGIGPKKAGALWRELEIENLDELKAAAEANDIQKLAGFGKKTEAKILKEIDRHRSREHRHLRSLASQYAEDLHSALSQVSGVERVELAGSYRRKRETVGDLDILVVADADAVDAVMEAFVQYDGNVETLAHGSKKSSIRLRSGIQVDLRVVEKAAFGAALYYFTGSKEHNVETRKMAQERDLKINEYGVWKQEERVAGETEASIFEALKLAWIPPELRENRGEIEAAAEDTLPDLIEQASIRGDLHAHTEATDGRLSLSDLVEEARSRGYEYLAVTDHSQALTVANGLDETRLRKQIDQIRALNEALDDFTVLTGIEVDILEDGSLDLPDSVLSELDIVIASIHSYFSLTKTKQTDRLLKALANPNVTILGHPTGRLLERRDPLDADFDRVLEAAVECGIVLEINANPHRLDLSDVYARRIKELGGKIAISTDAHKAADFGHMRWGIGQARRAWLTADDVINTRSAPELLELLHTLRNEGVS